MTKEVKLSEESMSGMIKAVVNGKMGVNWATEQGFQGPFSRIGCLLSTQLQLHLSSE